MFIVSSAKAFLKTETFSWIKKNTRAICLGLTSVGCPTFSSTALEKSNQIKFSIRRNSSSKQASHEAAGGQALHYREIP